MWVSTIKNNLSISKWFFVYLSRANYLIHNNSCYNVNINKLKYFSKEDPSNLCDSTFTFIELNETQKYLQVLWDVL